MNNTAILLEIHNEHMGRDGDPVRDLDGCAPMGYGGNEVEDPDGGPVMAVVVIVCACVGGGFVVGWVVGAWLALVG